MQFFSPEAFIYLWSLPALILLFGASHKIWEKRLAQFAELTTVTTKLMPAYDPQERRTRLVYLLLVFIFATLALARPQWGEAKKKIQRKGVDVIVLLDTSLSMLAEDVKPNRFEKAKLEIKTLIRNLKGDRVGMIAFAGSGFLQAPLTLDYSTFLLFLEGIEVGYIPDPGTSLAQALGAAIRSFPPNNLTHKALILFTDGEDHVGGVGPALEEVKKQGIRIYPIGVGTLEGQPIPLQDEHGRKVGFKKDRAGEIVITKLNSSPLEKMAAETGGIYLPATPGEEEIGILLKHMEGMGKKQLKEQLITEKEDHFQILLLLAVVFLILEMMYRRTAKPAGAALRNDIPAAAALLTAFFLQSGFLESPKGLTDKGNKLYQEKKYQSALQLYQRAKVKNPDHPHIRYDLGTTLYQVEQFQEAARELEKAIASSAANPELQARALYNYGNTQYRLGNFEKAIESYQKTLELNPKDEDAKYNLEFLQNEKSLFEKKNQERKKQEQQEQQKQQQQPQQQKQQSQGQQDQRQESPQDQSKGEQDKEEQDKESPPSPQPQPKPEPEHKPKEQPQDQEQRQQQPEQREQDQEQKKPEQEPAPAEPLKEEAQGGRAPLQGQMSLENAIQLLNALKDSEKELQDLRRPPAREDPVPVLKDW